MTNARDKANIPVLNFQSKGIDDNATSTAITIDSSQNVSFAEDISTGNNGVLNILDGDGDISGKLANQSSSAHSLEIIADPSNSGANSNMIFKIDNTERMRIDSSGNVGIGVSSPQEVLHLKDGDIAVGNGTASNDAVIGRIGFSTDSSNSRFIGIESFRGSDAANADLRFHTFGGDSNSGERMRIDTSGNVGIGNTVASTINSANGTGNLVVGSGSGTEGITIYSGTTGEGTLQFADGTSGSATYVGQINYNHSSNDMSFTSGGTERIRLLGTGNVGIGTSSPGCALEVSGTASLMNNVTRVSANYHQIADAGANTYTLKIHNKATSTGAQYINEVAFTAANPDNNSARFYNMVDSSAVRCDIYSDGDIKNHDNSYGSLSDERIKQNIVDSGSQWDDIKAVKVRKFKKKDDVRQYGDKAWVQIGVIAQELEAAGMDKLIRHSEPSPSDILSDSTFGTLYEDGDEIPEGKAIGDIKEIKAQVKGVGYSVLYMKAVKALQEAMERIETLETKVQTLENNQP
jgi:hypothetical protein